jgi:uncharacterized protein (TIGR03032 family)
VNEFELVRLQLDQLEPSVGFAAWLSEQRVSLAITKGGGLCLIGLDSEGCVSLDESQLGMCMGLAARGPDTLFVATRYQIWRFENAIPPGETDERGNDRLFLPQTAWTTGTLLVRDLDIVDTGDLLFVNGLFSCLSTPGERLNFEPVWLPTFVSRLAPEDRCYLSGVSLQNGRAAFVTAASRSDQPGGWREYQRDGGIVIDVPTGEVIATGLSMPCSPVLVDQQLWLCLGGSGELARIDTRGGELARVSQLPGFTRGLAILGRWAVVAVSGPQRGEDFSGLPLSDRPSAPAPAGRCGIFVVDLESGRPEHSLLMSGGASDIYGLEVLEDTARASSVRFTGEDVQELVTFPGAP